MRAWHCLRFTVSLVFTWGVLFGNAGAAEALPAVFMTPSQGSIVSQSTFDVSVFVDTAGRNVKEISLALRFDPAILQITAPLKGTSFIDDWVNLPRYSNFQGTIEFQGRISGSGLNTSGGLLATIGFRGVGVGKSEIIVDPKSEVVFSDGSALKLTQGARKFFYNIFLATAAGAEIFSLTHPNPSEWYNNNTPIFEWILDPLTEAVSYSLDRDSDASPDTVPEERGKIASFSDIEDGIWFFHIIFLRDRIWSPASYFPMQIDTTPPRHPDIYLEGNTRNTLRARELLYFSSRDDQSGIDYYAISIFKKEEGDIQNSGFIEAVSPFQISFPEDGTYVVSIKVVDKVGNSKTGQIEVRKVSGNIWRAWIFVGRVMQKIFSGSTMMLLIVLGAAYLAFNFLRGKFNLTWRLRRDMREIERRIQRDRLKMQEDLKLKEEIDEELHEK